MFKSKYLMSDLPETAIYHDDFNGEGVWFNLPIIPHFIDSNDFREFNGKSIKDISDFLESYFDKYWDFDIDTLREFIAFKNS